MKINRGNYEAYVVDYLDGNLDESLVNDFIEFIRQNPDLKKEMEEMKSISLQPENFEFGKKDALYKERLDAENVFNNAAIAKLEGDLTGDNKAEFENYLSTHPEKQKDAKLFTQTKLQPNESIKFQNKNQLHRHNPRRNLILWAGRIAAVLVLAISIYLFVDNNRESGMENQVAFSETKKPFDDTPVQENSTESQSQNASKPEQVENNLAATQENENNVAQENNTTTVDQESLMAENIENPTSQSETEAIRTSRESISLPAKVNTRSAAINPEKPHVILASIDRQDVVFPDSENTNEERLIGEAIREKAGLDNLSVNSITQVGLKLVSAVSKNNFTYETNSNGEVTELSFDSRLMAFSIPTNKDN